MGDMPDLSALYPNITEIVRSRGKVYVVQNYQSDP